MGHTFSSLITETTKLPIFAFGTLPSFLTPRDKKSSHSFSEETSSELVWLVRKIQSKRVGKAKQSSIYYFLQNYTKSCLWEQAPEMSV